MKYARILEAFYSTPLALEESKLWLIHEFLLRAAAAEAVAEERVTEIVAGRREDGVQMAGKVAVVSVFGIISQRVGLLERASGGIGTEELGATLDSLVNDKAVKAICMVFDSPGGSVYGVAELGAKIASYRGQKKVVGVADSVAASAAYWLLSQCQEVNVTGGGQVGSIGVLTAHEDMSKRLEAKGRTVTVVSAGKYKTETMPFAPLSEEAKAELQAMVDHYYGMFVGAVARGRGVSEGRVKADFGQGRMVTAKEAVSRGMADHVATLEQVLRRLGGDVAQGGAGAISPAMAAARARAAEIED